MPTDQVFADFAALPVEAQRQAADFIAFLRQRYAVPAESRVPAAPELNSELFVGMWQDRDDMQDSAQWVRDLRQQEWTR